VIRVSNVFVFSFMLVLCIGCSSNSKAPTMANVEGTVTLDGQPMSSGEVMFVVPGKHTAVLPVAGGAFSGQAVLGSNRVEVYSYRTGGEVVDMGGEKFGGELENIIPAKFNVNSTLTAQVEAQGGSDFQFEVSSK
jgi:hypothetical protein